MKMTALTLAIIWKSRGVSRCFIFEIVLIRHLREEWIYVTDWPNRYVCRVDHEMEFGEVIYEHKDFELAMLILWWAAERCWQDLNVNGIGERMVMSHQWNGRIMMITVFDVLSYEASESQMML